MKTVLIVDAGGRGDALVYKYSQSPKTPAKCKLFLIGPEEAIEAGFAVVGPTQAAARIEWDKAWAREFMKKYKLPA